MLRRQLIPPVAEPAPQVVLTCGDQDCQHTFTPEPTAYAAGSLACPCCGGWTFHAALAAPTGGGR